MTEVFDVVIVGAGDAGAQAAIALRQQKFTGSILMIGDEPDLPYERPPLSKDYFSGEKGFERILIRPAAFWDERKVSMLLNHKVVSVQPEERSVTLWDGKSVRYSNLIWATGGRPRQLTCSGSALRGVHSVRTRADVDRMASELDTTERVVVIGGGYIGLEAAAVLTKFHKHVTIVEAQDRVLARVAGVTLSRFFEEEHRLHGVDILLSTSVDCIEEADGAVSGVRLSNDVVLPAEMVIVGIGIIPAVEPLLEAGAQGGNGVLIDSLCRTSLQKIWAIGDCALHSSVHADEDPIRLESVQNANDMANVAARSIVGEADAYCALPWFWSNQYDLKLQTVGLSSGHDEEICRGDPASRSFSIIYRNGGNVVAIDAVNCIKDYVQGKALILSARHFARSDLEDPIIPLKSIMEASL